MRGRRWTRSFEDQEGTWSSWRTAKNSWDHVGVSEDGVYRVVYPKMTNPRERMVWWRARKKSWGYMGLSPYSHTNPCSSLRGRSVKGQRPRWIQASNVPSKKSMRCQSLQRAGIPWRPTSSCAFFFWLRRTRKMTISRWMMISDRFW